MKWYMLAVVTVTFGLITACGKKEEPLAPTFPAPPAQIATPAPSDSNLEAVKETAPETATATEGVVEKAAEETEKTANEVATAVEKTADEAADTAGKAASEAADTAQKATEEAAQGVQKAADDLLGKPTE